MIFKKAHMLFGQLQESLDQINNIQYTTPIETLDGATIGQHTRHVVEHFQCLVKSITSGKVNYDDRTRDLDLESNILSCIEAIEVVKKDMDHPDFELNVMQDFIKSDLPMDDIKSSYFREVLYNIDHLVHHQALLKIGLLELKPTMHMSEHFGYADATIKYKKHVHAELPSS